MECSTCFEGVMKTPLGWLRIRGSRDALSNIDFLEGRPAHIGVPAALDAACHQIEHYFGDGGFRFSLPLAAVGTPFQRRVWEEIGRIPPGATLTYGELAQRVGSSARAVGNACRRNPVPIVVPCHRVVSATGPGGYAGDRNGRLAGIKRWLLEHERASG
jgi:methylated-DNA-[protein]-cysteine S-methyltransferase